MRLDLLQAELRSALLELKRLKARVVALEARVRLFEAEEGREARSAAGSREARASSGRASAGSPGERSRAPSGRTDPIAAEETPGREELCRDIAAFINRALRGEHRGSSRRDRLRVAKVLSGLLKF